ncbi:MAG: AI-2E family transporter [Spongiibacteraceae bacterium]
MAQGSFLLALLLITLLFGWILQPWAGAILWAGVIAILFYPLQQRLAPRFVGRPNLLAFAVLSVCTLIVILPTLGVLATLTQEGAALYEKMQSGEIDLMGYFERSTQIPEPVQQLLNRFNIDLGKVRQMFKDVSVQTSQYLAGQLLSFGQNAAQFLVAFAVMLYLTFFFLRDGKMLVRLIVRALPLGDERERLLLEKTSTVIGASIRGNLVVAAVQGTLGGLTFWALGIPAPLLGGVMMAFASLIPSVGAALIWAPVAIYLLLIGWIWQGVVLIVVGAGVIGLVDNLLRPILVGRETKMPDYLVLMSTLGGISIFGLNGFVLGPLIATLFIGFWAIFIRDFDPD